MGDKVRYREERVEGSQRIPGFPGCGSQVCFCSGCFGFRDVRHIPLIICLLFARVSDLLFWSFPACDVPKLDIDSVQMKRGCLA